MTEEQYEAVSNFVAGQNVLVSLPTSMGKSLCYLVLPVVFEYLRSPSAAAAPLGKSILVVVSPLKCLMEDQVARFSSRGVRSTKEKCKQSVLGQDVENGQYQIVFFSPECMLTELKWREMFRSEVYQKNVIGLVIDEAHCIEKMVGSFSNTVAVIMHKYLKEYCELLPDS